jgi:hypothetical protein
MANTVFQHKRSGTPAAVPSSLEFGELGINYADGLIFYKNATSHIVSISGGGGGGGNAFGTVNANGTLVVADTPGDVLNLVAGTNITFSVDAVNDIITINGGAGGDVSAPFAQANAARDHANAAFDAANSAGGGLSFTSNVGDAVANTFNITHALNSTTIIPAVRERSTGYYVYPDIKMTSPNNLVIEFVSIPTANQYFLIVLGV